MATNAKKARQQWLTQQSQTKPLTASKPKLPRKPRQSRESKREDALYRHAERVYDTDRDYDCEEFS